MDAFDDKRQYIGTNHEANCPIMVPEPEIRAPLMPKGNHYCVLYEYQCPIQKMHTKRNRTRSEDIKQKSTSCEN